MSEKILKQPVIEDVPLPDGSIPPNFDVTQPSSGGTSETAKIKSQRLPYKRIATEVIASALNTKSRKILAEFDLVDSGGLKIGDYTPGVSGDLKLTPNGIVGRNDSGITTFAFDATTGNVVILGSIQAGSVITGEVIVGNNNVIIDGENSRIIVYDEDGIPGIIIGFHKNGF